MISEMRVYPPREARNRAGLTWELVYIPIEGALSRSYMNHYRI